MSGSIYDWPRYYESVTTFRDGTRFVYRWESDHTPPMRRSDYGGWTGSTYDHESFARDVAAGALVRIIDPQWIAALTPVPVETFTPLARRPETLRPEAVKQSDALPSAGEQAVMNWHPRPTCKD